MTENPFYRLAPFIQDFIYRAKWDALRGVQVQTTQAIFDTPNHVLIMSGTASGKTEAAFLPVLTDIYNDPPSSIGVLYIGPLKALINDQFQRLIRLLEGVDISVQSWHGDVSRSKKEKFLKEGRGILQITPESLEALFIKRQSELGRLFGELRFVVIDEVHAFIDGDRGRQIICQLQRLGRYQKTPPRRIGLSATIGDPQLAMKWLQGGTTTAVTLVDDKTQHRSIELGLEHYLKVSPMKYPSSAESNAEPDAMFEAMYGMTRQAQKTLIFANQRSEAEEVTVNLRDIAQRQKQPDIYYIHHGNIAAPLREAAESAMQNPDQAACTIATVTLELGIDLGQLDQVLQLNATNSVSSFIQRLGRSGRRGGASRMFFYIREVVPDEKASLGKQIPWDLLQTISIIQLYLEEHWIEPPSIPKLPFSLLYHQTMSCLTTHTELKPPQLAEQVLTLPPFAYVTQEHYRDLLRYLLEIKHLERTEIGSLIVGLAGEKIVNDYSFYATFEDDILYQVRDTSREVGTLTTVPLVGERIALAGHAWKVLDVNRDKRVIFVEPVAGKARPHWDGRGRGVHTRVLERIRTILTEDSHYGYLQPHAVAHLDTARQLAKASGMLEQSILPLGGDTYMLIPWQGTRVFSTIVMLLRYMNIDVKSEYLPFYVVLKLPDGIHALQKSLQVTLDAGPTGAELIAELQRNDVQKGKYDKFVPEHLLKEAFAVDSIDMENAIEYLQRIANGLSPRI